MSEQIDAETVETIRHRYATEAISQPDLAEDMGVGLTTVQRYAVGGKWKRTDDPHLSITVANDTTVLTYSTSSDRFHLPTDEGAPVCGESVDNWWPKERAVLPWHEPCRKCACQILNRGAHLTAADVTVEVDR